MRDQGPAYPLWLTLSRFVHREIIVLVILSGAAIVGFIATRAAAEAAEDLRLRDAQHWYERGMAQLEAGRPGEAVEAFGRARALNRDAPDYHLGFARALVATGQTDAARQALLALRQTRPEDPRVNLGLAEIEAGAGNTNEAVRFYQSALYGEWDAEDLEQRTALRRRVIQYLIDQDMNSRAVAQLLLLEGDVPADPRDRTEIAEWFLEAGDPVRALAEFRRAIELDPGYAPAHAGAARAAFELADFPAVRRHLARAPAGAAGLDDLRELTPAVIASDPLGPRLSQRERQRRLDAGLAHLTPLVESCAQQLADTPAGQTLASHAAALTRARDAAPEDLDTAVSALSRAAAALPPDCGPMDLTTRAWIQIGRAHPERSP